MRSFVTIRNIVLAAVAAAASLLMFSLASATNPYGWSLSSSDVTPARSGAAVSQDGTTAPAQTLLFGGKAATGVVNDTWRWNGAWTKLNPTTSPTARSGATLVYDPVHNQALLFGGANSAGGVLKDTWAWNGTTWTHLSPAKSPPARQNAAAAWDPVHHVIVLFGGATKTAKLQDTWTEPPHTSLSHN